MVERNKDQEASSSDAGMLNGAAGSFRIGDCVQVGPFRKCQLWMTFPGSDLEHDLEVTISGDQFEKIRADLSNK